MNSQTRIAAFERGRIEVFVEEKRSRMEFRLYFHPLRY